MSATTAERAAFAAILVAFLALSLIYNFVTPAGEGVDEISHLQYTLYVKDHRALPVLPFTTKADTVLMGYHAPLYYVIAAIASTPLPTDDLSQALRPNPHFIWIEGVGPGNRNVFLHSPLTGQDPLPWQGIVLTIHLLRFLSTLQGLAALVFIRVLLRHLVAQPTLVLAATAATAFQPTFVNTFSLAHNDGTVALFTIVGVLWTVRFSKGQPSVLTAANAVVGGAILGLGLLAKETSFALGPVYAVGYGILALEHRRWKVVGRALAATLGTGVGIAGWWYARNWLLYGDPLARNLFAALYHTELLQGPYQWGNFLAFLQQLSRNYWGAFGYVHILADPNIGNALWLLAGLAVPGFLLTVATRRHDRAFVVAWGIALTAVSATSTIFVQWSTVVGGGAAHGRFFVGVMPVLNAAVILGLSRYTAKRWPLGPFLFAGFLGAFGFVAPFLYIAPAYRPPLAQPAEIARATPEDKVFGNQLRLLAASLGTSSIEPGQETRISLFWRRENALDADLRFRVRVMARDGSTVFSKAFWPAGGGVPTFTWPAGAVYRDTIPIPIPANTAPGWAKLLLTVETTDGKGLVSAGGEGLNHEVEIGHLAVADLPIVSTLPAGARPVGAHFVSPDGGDQLSLVGYRLDPIGAGSRDLNMQLFWQTQVLLTDDITVSVQLLDTNGHLVAQNDSEPANGQAPTSTWPSGAIIEDSHRIALPATLNSGVYRVVIVAYTRPDLHRLIVINASTQTDYLQLDEVRLNL